MRLLVIAVAAAVLAILLTVALLGYRQDQRVIRWFDGTGVAAKLDVAGQTPRDVSIEDARTGTSYTFEVAADGTFVAPLPPDVYRFAIPGDARTITLTVPAGDCLDLVLDYRLPLVVLRVPREGWPLPTLA
jgi:hypothetical protein